MTGPSSPCGDSTHVACPNGCGGEVVAGRYDHILLQRVDDEGFPLGDPETGELLKVRMPLPFHVLDDWHSFFDPTGLVPAGCDHGIRTHPDPRVAGSPMGLRARSWVRSKYLVADPGIYGQCVVCRGDPRPPDLTEPLHAPAG